jgi:class 3 adenylate cyclase
MAETRSLVPLLIVFVDLTRYSAQSQRVSDSELADTIDAYYEFVAAAVDAAHGTLVKFVGDGVLLVFPEGAVDRAVEMLVALKESVDEFMIERGWECRLTAKAHFGTAVAGPFGARDAKRYDVIGKVVNTAARLESTGITLSVEAFGKLAPELRPLFKKHTPITYIRAGDQRPTWKGIR